MNEKADKPEDEAPDNLRPELKMKPLREITDEELQQILTEHKKWLESNGKEGKQAILPRTDFRRKTLHGKDLRKAILYDSDFSGANLYKAKFQEAILNGTNLENAFLMSANLHKASMIDIKGLHTATLQNCNLEGVTGLKGTEFGRADITGAKLPEDIRDFKILKIVEETSKNARKIFLAMLLGCAYSWLTIFTTTDVNLLTNSSSSPLPIIRTAIPIAWFYLTAPILLVGFYLYLHFYLHRLWEGLAGLPARFEDGKRLDERAYPWLLTGLVRRHFDKIKSKRLSIARPEEWVSIILAWWVVPITMCSFWLRYIPRHDWTGTIIHITLIILSIAAGIIFYRSHVRTLREKKPPQWRTYLAVTLAILTLIASIVLSDGSINGIRGEGIPKIFDRFDYDVFADFYEKEVSTRPDNYWVIDPEDRDDSVIGADLQGADLRWAEARRAFMAKADLRNARLQGALLYYANLKGANLRWTNLERAALAESNLEGADLYGANLQGANLKAANLKKVNLEGANLVFAHLEGADLFSAQGLTQEQLDAACGDSLTILPPGLTIEDCPEEEKEAE